MIKISFLLAKDYFLPHIISGSKVSTLIMKKFPPGSGGRKKIGELQSGSGDGNICQRNSGTLAMDNEKIKKMKPMKSIIARLKAQGKKVVFTNGCFDILHVGHIRYLRKAKEQGDILVIGLNTDRSVRKIKGEKRPIVSEKERAEVLSALEFVDYVVFFNEPDPFLLIQSLKPNVLVKGADWPKDEIIGREVVEKAGGRIVRVPLVRGASSTGVIEKIIKVYCP